MAKPPVNRETVKKIIDALTPMNPDTAEKFVQDLLRAADERRREVERVVGDVARAGVRTAEGLASSMQQEMARQMTKMAARIDDLERQVESLNRALESTKSHLLSLASRSSVAESEKAPQAEQTTGKSSKKSARKAEKKAKKSKIRVEDAVQENVNPGASDSGSSPGPVGGSPAVAGI